MVAPGHLAPLLAGMDLVVSFVLPLVADNYVFFGDFMIPGDSFRKWVSGILPPSHASLFYMSLLYGKGFLPLGLQIFVAKEISGRPKG